jgi:two-component system response regulator
MNFHSTRPILLVEDNPDDELLAIRALRKSDAAVTVAVARDGKEALEYLAIGEGADSAAAPVLPAVVLLDLQLNGMNGLDVLRRIRANERTRHLPVVVLTSSLEKQDVEGAYQLYANSYIRKPVDFDTFCAAARDIMVFWRDWNVTIGPEGIT